jgi:hypothetical protein
MTPLGDMKAVHSDINASCTRVIILSFEAVKVRATPMHMIGSAALPGRQITN